MNKLSINIYIKINFIKKAKVKSKNILINKL